jgi:hypothetical protein
MFLVEAFADEAANRDHAPPAPAAAPPVAANGVAHARGRGLGRGRNAAGVGAGIGGGAAVPAARGRGRAGWQAGERETEMHRLQISRGMLRRGRSRTPRGIGFAEGCAQAAFGEMADHFDRAQRSTTVWTAHSGATFATQVDQRHRVGADAARGVASHVVAQARGINEFIHSAPPPPQTLLHLFTNVFDDADMWVQKGEGSEDVLRRREAARDRLGPKSLEDKIREKMARKRKISTCR